MSRKSEKEGLTRRDFVRNAALIGAAGGILGGAVGGGLTWATAEAEPAPSKWDDEADVVIVGYGGSGVCAAIAAKDAGSSVIVLEKAPKAEGGNTGVATGSIHDCIKADDVNDFINKIRYGCFGTTPDEDTIKATAANMQDTYAWLTNLGAQLVQGAHTTANAQHTGGYSYTIANGVAAGTTGAGKDLFAFLNGVATTKGVNPRFATPAQALIQDPGTKEIQGVKAKAADGTMLYIKANQAVIMACGGYENNPELQGWFNYPGMRLWPWGTPYNTGDGIFMTASVGAALWHLHGLEWATVGFRKASESVGVSVGTNASSGVTPYNYLFCNKYGSRFMNEARTMGHDVTYKPVTAIDDVKVEFPNLPFFLVCDSTLIKAGPLAPRQARTGLWTTYNSVFAEYVWSTDNSVEIGKGWVFQADTIAELAAKITGTDPSGATVSVDPAGLAAAVTKFNAAVTAAKDADFSRPANQMAAISTPPYYAVEMSLATINTQGGPAHNAVQPVARSRRQSHPSPVQRRRVRLSQRLRVRRRQYRGGPDDRADRRSACRQTVTPGPGPDGSDDHRQCRRRCSRHGPRPVGVHDAGGGCRRHAGHRAGQEARQDRLQLRSRRDRARGRQWNGLVAVLAQGPEHRGQGDLCLPRRLHRRRYVRPCRFGRDARGREVA